MGRSIRGVGPFSDLLPAETQSLAEQAWEAVLTQYGRVQSRHSWVCDNQDSPLFGERDEAARRSEAKLRSMLAWLFAWLGAGPEEAFEVLCVLAGEPDQLDVWAVETTPGTEGPQDEPGEATQAALGVGGTTSHKEPALSESPLRASWDPTGCLRLDNPTCYDRVLELARLLGWPAVSWPARSVPVAPNLDLPARSVSDKAGWQAFLSEMVSLRHPRSVDSLFFAEVALIRSELGFAVGGGKCTSD